MNLTFLKRVAVVLLAILAGMLILYGLYFICLILNMGIKPKALPDSSVSIDKITSLNYVEVVQGCGPYYNTEACVNVRSGPGLSYPVIEQLRTGIVLQVGNKVEADGHVWYKVVFENYLRYPERVIGDWYIYCC